MISEHTQNKTRCIFVTPLYCFYFAMNHSGAWTSKTNDQQQWIQVKFQMPFTITAIQTQGRSDKSQWVKSYKVSYSSNMVDWITYTNGDGLEEVNFTGLISFLDFMCAILRYRYSHTYNVL